jgi:hypothetical protein
VKVTKGARMTDEPPRVEDLMRRFLTMGNEICSEGTPPVFVASGMLTAAIEAYGQTQGGPHATVAWLRDMADHLEAAWSKGPTSIG